MGIKNWLFGKKRDADAEALATLKAQINRYEHEARNLERQADEQKIIAAKMLKAGNKTGAREALKRRAIYMKRLNRVHNMIMNLEAQMKSIQEASATVETVKAMEIGAKVMGEKIKQVTPEKAQKVTETVAMQQEELDMITETIADPSLSEGILDYEDDQAIEAQMAELEQEIQLGSTAELPDISDLPSTPTKTKKEKEEDISDLEKELEELKKQTSGEQN
ncbi:Snf7 family protein [Candidatus Bathyarchaeota archaeon]|nr:Snf7 family protein [Candidatus Bathyarchaeota archaeon]